VDKVICALSGTEPSNWCKSERNEVFASDQLPLPASQDLRREVKLDAWTGLQASDACGKTTDKVTVIRVSDPWAIKWFDTRDGRNWLDDNGFDVPPVYAPERECTTNDPRPILELNVSEGAIISQSTMVLQGTADATGGFKSWRLEFGLGQDPDSWTRLAEGGQPVNNGVLFNWDMSNLPNQTITLHLYLKGKDGFAEKFVHFSLALPTATPTPTATQIFFPTDTPTPVTPTDTLVPTDTPAPTDTPTDTATP
jgi:hypothetical protein